jgi:hypothetical protein
MQLRLVATRLFAARLVAARLIAACALLTAAPWVGATPGQVLLNDVAIEIPQLLWPALPGEVLTVTVEPSADVAAVRFDGRELERAPGPQRIVAPDSPGHYPLVIESADGARTVNVAVMWPASSVREGRLNGFRIGAYPAKPLQGLAIYEPPPGFIEVNGSNHRLPVSPSYTLGEFVSKQPGEFPKYVVLDPKLLIKLEIIKDELRRAGFVLDKFTIMSGYRTPVYNRAIQNSDYSRHVWGGAADIFIDQTGDGRMDDLNGDGKVNLADAKLLFDFIDRLSRSGRFGKLIGGIGLYDGNAVRGPFVHVDARGTEARW